MNVEALLASPHWRWMPGMLDINHGRAGASSGPDRLRSSRCYLRAGDVARVDDSTAVDVHTGKPLEVSTAISCHPARRVGAVTIYSAKVMRTGAAILDLLRGPTIPITTTSTGTPRLRSRSVLGPPCRGYGSTEWLANSAEVSIPTARRALAFLREVGCPLTYSPEHAAWVLADRLWSLPLFELRPAGWVPTDKAEAP